MSEPLRWISTKDQPVPRDRHVVVLKTVEMRDFETGRKYWSQDVRIRYAATRLQAAISPGYWDGWDYWCALPELQADPEFAEILAALKELGDKLRAFSRGKR